jgi:hypothetical protein
LVTQLFALALALCCADQKLRRWAMQQQARLTQLARLPGMLRALEA